MIHVKLYATFFVFVFVFDFFQKKNLIKPFFMFVAFCNQKTIVAFFDNWKTEWFSIQYRRSKMIYLVHP